MASSPTSTCSALLILLLISFSVHCYQTVAGSRSREFDYFALTLQWPGTICQSTHHCCSSNACCRGSFVPTEFTIHGLWPDYNDGTWPACCSDSDFDLKKISSLVETLEKYWPSLSCSLSSNCHGGKGSFWEHEWEKHGTCSFPVFQNEYSYFSTALQLYFKYNITKILNHAGYLPDNYHKYPLGDIVATIKKAVGALPQLVCSHGAVEELRLCFYKDFKPRDCLTVSDTKHVMHEARSSCPRFIRLPETKPLTLQSATISGLSSQPLRWD